MTQPLRCDFLVVGAGIAGASAAYFLASLGNVIVLEMESVPGYHSTGRSAALFSDYYGNSAVQALTTASRSFFLKPPPGFTDPLLTPRGTLALCPHGTEERFDGMLATGLTASIPFRELDAYETLQLCPAVRPEWFSRAMLKPSSMDIDVDALHQGFLRGIKARGGRVLRSTTVKSLSGLGGWRVYTDAGTLSTGCVINAAGAWADEIADLAGVHRVGLTPLRRTVAIVAPPAGTDVTRWPVVTDVTDTFYIKPESGQLLISPSDATPVPAGDVRPDDIDVALALDRVQAATTMAIKHVSRAWAGLRSAVPDDTPVVGKAPDADGFFWLAALSGYGIQTAPAIGRLAASLAAGEPSPILANEPGLELATIAPERFF
jgi:D-arginine dehydrogenase